MIYLQLEKAKAQILPKRQTPSNWGTQSRWVLRSQDGRVAEENNKNSNPKVLPLGFFVGERKKMREPRVYKEDSVYHITVEASNRENLFREESDQAYFIELIKARKEKYNFKLHAHRLLIHSFHLLIEPSVDANISKIMQAINTSYSLYFNNKYKRTGHLFSSRYKCELLDKDENLLAKKVEELQRLEVREPSIIFVPILLKRTVPVFISVIIITGLAISLKFLPHSKPYTIAKKFAKQEMQADFPRGLPIYSTVHKQERQVWELWKLGPQE